MSAAAFSASLALVTPLGMIGGAKAAARASSDGALPSLDRATAWLNSPPLTAAGLRGKVVLVDFWTYTCINWLRSLPYVRAWAERYRDHGLVVIGVHAPEFAFEKDLENVRRAAKDLAVGYPIAIDNNHAIWRAFENHSWPALYLFDAQGRLRHHHFGEGEYERSERIIQQVLADSGVAGDPPSPGVGRRTRGGGGGRLDQPEVAGELSGLREDARSSPRPEVHDRARLVPTRFRRDCILNQWALVGDWTVEKHAAVLNEANGRIAYRFHARDLHLVMRPTRALAGRAISRAHRRTAARARSRTRRGRAGHRHGRPSRVCIS